MLNKLINNVSYHKKLKYMKEENKLLKNENTMLKEELNRLKTQVYADMNGIDTTNNESKDIIKTALSAQKIYNELIKELKIKHKELDDMIAIAKSLKKRIV